MPWTPASRMPRSPDRSERYSECRVVWNVYGAPEPPTSQGPVGGVPGDVLVDGETGVDTGPVHLRALHVQGPDGGAMPLGQTPMTSISAGNRRPASVR